MHDPLGMGHIQCIGNLNSVVQHLFSGKWPDENQVFERLPFQQLHGKEGLPLFIADFIDGADTGMI